MTADYSAEIKTAIFQYVSERLHDEERSSSNCGRIAEKLHVLRKLQDYWTEVHQICTRCRRIIAI